MTDKLIINAIENNDIDYVINYLANNNLDFSKSLKFTKKSIYFKNLDILKIMLNDKRFIDKDILNTALYHSVVYERFDFVKTLLTYKEIEPYIENNKIIKEAFISNNMDITYLLYEVESVRKTLKNDNFRLFNAINSKYINKKLISF